MVHCQRKGYQANPSIKMACIWLLKSLAVNLCSFLTTQNNSPLVACMKNSQNEICQQQVCCKEQVALHELVTWLVVACGYFWRFLNMFDNV